MILLWTVVMNKFVSYRSRLIRMLIFIIIFVSCHSAFARDFSKLYPKAELVRIQNVYGNNIRIVLFNNIRQYLNTSERQTLSTISLDILLYGENSGLFDYTMDTTTGKMTLTALSIKFFDDLAIAFAWYESHNLDKQKIIEYIANLYANPENIKPPLPSLGVPEKAWEIDPFVDDVSQKTLKSAITFLLLHEFAHWHYRHSAYNVISNRGAKKQEKQSDAFALDVMARMHTIPYGMVYWFMVTGLINNNEARTHPIFSERLYAIARELEYKPEKFIGKENVNTLKENDVKQVAQEIKIIASALEK